MVWLLVDRVIQLWYYGNGVAKSVRLSALLQNHQKVIIWNINPLTVAILIFVYILDSVAPLAVLTGHHTPIVCIAVNCSLGIVASGAMCK